MKAAPASSSNATTQFVPTQDFCGHRLANIKKLAAQTDDSIVRAQVIAMVERCPSGSNTYALDENAADIEPDLPKQVAVTNRNDVRRPHCGSTLGDRQYRD